MTEKALSSSIPANNEKVIEIYKKIKSGQLNPSPEFQRKLVWKKQHKFNFIETILLNYPFPEIYKAPGNLDVTNLELKDEIVDGQQRVTTIVNFIDGKDVFSSDKAPYKFSSLTDGEKRNFLNYEVSVRYLKNASDDQVKEIFQRINNTEYSLNSMERLNAQWGDSELVCFCKQLIEEELTVNIEFLEYKMSEESRKEFLRFFHDKKIFSENDNNRMLSLQYTLTLVATLVTGEYFRRNDKTQLLIETFNEEFPEASMVEFNLLSVINFIDLLGLDESSYWFNKANLFTLICELYDQELSNIDSRILSGELAEIEAQHVDYNLNNNENIDNGLIRYFEYAKEGVNEVNARKYRGKLVSDLVSKSRSN